jgi:hypothetical protein
MNGYELYVPYLIAERHQQAEADRLARAAKKAARQVEEAKGADDVQPIYHGEPWMPVLRGYPYDPEFGR